MYWLLLLEAIVIHATTKLLLSAEALIESALEASHLLVELLTLHGRALTAHTAELLLSTHVPHVLIASLHLRVLLRLLILLTKSWSKVIHVEPLSSVVVIAHLLLVKR